MLDALVRLDRKLKRLDKYLPPPPPPPIEIPKEVYAHVRQQLPHWALPLLEPCRYKCLYGGRGGAKSISMVDALIVESLGRVCRILCAREFQNSIKDSVYALIALRVSDLGLGDYFEFTNDRVRTANGSEFFFKGIRCNTDSIKSMAGLTHLFIEEAQPITKSSWDILVPTVRKEGSEIWVSFNPDSQDDIVYDRFVVNPIKGAFIAKVLYSDNPYFPQVLEDERRLMEERDPDGYRHVWLGELLKHSKAQVLADKWEIDDFTPGAGWQGPFQGADFGFSATDPTVLVRCWIYHETLYIEHESYHYRLEIDDMSAQWKADVPDCDRVLTRGDSSRADTISYLRRNGMPKLGSVKKGTIEDGIAYLRSFKKIIIHHRCEGLISEAKLYRRKVDERTGEITNQILDMHNHGWDAVRYALRPLQRISEQPKVPPSHSYRR